jgi:hypothetical protein
MLRTSLLRISNPRMKISDQKRKMQTGLWRKLKELHNGYAFPSSFPFLHQIADFHKHLHRQLQAEKQKGHHYHNPLASSSHPKSAIKRSIPAHLTNDLEPERKKRRVSVVAPGEESVAESPAGDDSVEGDQIEGVRLRRSGMRASTLAMKEQIDVRLREQKERNVSAVFFFL